MVSRQAWTLTLSISCLALASAVVAAVLVGSRPLDLHRALHGLSPDHEILMDLRLPRALLALWTGGALSVSGVLFQALLRESLATPDTLGVSGGASLGAVLAICCGWNSVFGVSAIWGAAFLGAAVVLGLVLLIASS